MILEGLLTTRSESAIVHLAPMGAEVLAEQVILRPFKTSTTWTHLSRERVAVFHITDQVELLVEAAIGRLAAAPVVVPELYQQLVLADCCHWWGLEVESIDDSQDRALVTARIVEQGQRREFLGFNRARHAVLEAAILATRTALLPQSEILDQLARLRPLVKKTGGPAEERAFQLVEGFIREQYAQGGKA